MSTVYKCDLVSYAFNTKHTFCDLENIKLIKSTTKGNQ